MACAGAGAHHAITDKQAEYAQQLVDKLRDLDFRVGIDSDNEKIGAKIRRAQLEKIPFMLVIGGREADAGVVAVRHRSEGDKGVMTPEAFIELLRAAQKE